MQSKNYLLVLLISVILLASCKQESNVFIDAKNPQIEYWGRVDSSQSNAVVLYWSSSAIKFNFEGRNLSTMVQDESGDNYYSIIIDDKKPFIFRPDTIKQLHLIAENLAPGKHSVEIHKRTEWDRGFTSFYGFKIEGDKAEIMTKPAEKELKMEFYGNSITAGYGVEDFSGKDRPDSIFTNSYLSYPSLIARHYNAEYQIICKSGIGITCSWFPIIMPDIYNRLNPTDSLSTWEFSNYNPDIVMINLFQNDSWLVNMTDHASFKKYYGTKAPTKEFIVNAYKEFVKSIRSKYPKATIICALGNMDITREGSLWPTYVEQAVSELTDNNIYTHFVPYKNTGGHPSIQEQEALANSLIAFINDLGIAQTKNTNQ